MWCRAHQQLHANAALLPTATKALRALMLRLQDASAAAPLQNTTWAAVAALLPAENLRQQQQQQQQQQNQQQLAVRAAFESTAGQSRTPPPLQQGPRAGLRADAAQQGPGEPLSSDADASHAPHPDRAASHSEAGQATQSWEQDPDRAASHSEARPATQSWEQCLPLWAADLGTYALTTLHAICAHTPQLRNRSHLVVHFVGASVGEDEGICALEALLLHQLPACEVSGRRSSRLDRFSYLCFQLVWRTRSVRVHDKSVQ